MDDNQNSEITTEYEDDVEDSDNIYVYVEESEDESYLDDSGLNYSQLPESSIEAAAQEGSGVSVILLLLKLLSNPIEGWKEVRRKRVSVEEAQRNCFYPLLAILAVSHFAYLFYSTRVTLSQIILGAVTSFVGFFAAYFCIVILLQILLPKDSGKCMDTNFGKVFVILNLSSLCLFFTAIELFPMLSPVLIFLPLWTVYMICRGTRFFKFPEDKTILGTGLLCILIVGLPFLIEWGLNQILPTDVQQYVR